MCTRTQAVTDHVTWSWYDFDSSK